MAEQDSLSNFDFTKMSNAGKFLKFESGRSVIVRILTKDPVIQEREFTDKNGKVTLSTKLNVTVWNFTDDRAQIMSVTPGVADRLKRIAIDDDYGHNIQKCDIKITPEGEMLKRVYDINVLRHSGSEKPLTQAMIDEAREIDLDNDVTDNRGRLSQWEPVQSSEGSGYAKARAVANNLGTGPQDKVITDLGGEPIDFEDIPF